ncbi:MAG: phosphate acyltransferase PlsX [Planctomycetes bacterium]|nr:phosphate acyltransferase PlsX [Planctomycetota bacterium]
MRIALDAMGGDHAPGEIVAGALLAQKELCEEDEILLIGDEPVVKACLGVASGWPKIRVVHAPEVVEMDESPVESLRRKKQSSIAIMAELASSDEADIAISAGNTGACVAACQMRMRLLPGVQRPGILVVFPTFTGPIAVIDVGANVSPKPSHLHQYALMASIYMHEILKVEDPTVGLVSVGQEDSKGNELIRSVNQMLREDSRIKFVGNLEAGEVMKRLADVVVCDGFVGNVILKFAEGLTEGLFKAIQHEMANVRVELAKEFEPIIKNIYAQHDQDEYGGAPLLGVNGTCIICHGSSKARVIRNTILRSKQQVTTQLNRRIVDRLQDVPVSGEKR